MVHCDFENGSQNLYFQGTLLVWRKGSQKRVSVYVLDNVGSSRRPLTCHVDCFRLRDNNLSRTGALSK